MLVENKARLVPIIQHCNEPGHAFFNKGCFFFFCLITKNTKQQSRKFICQVLESSDKRQESSDQNLPRAETVVLENSYTIIFISI